MARRFAEGTHVAHEKTRFEIERILTRYGCERFGVGVTRERAAITFTAHERDVRFEISLPPPDAARFVYDPRSLGRKRDGSLGEPTSWTKKRPAERAREAWQDEVNRLWRSLLLVIKAKLECVESGIMSFEREFLANIVLPGAQTVGDAVAPQIAKAYVEQRPGRLLQSEAGPWSEGSSDVVDATRTDRK